MAKIKQLKTAKNQQVSVTILVVADKMSGVRGFENLLLDQIRLRQVAAKDKGHSLTHNIM